MRSLRRLIQCVIISAGLIVPLAAHADTVTNWHADVTVSHDNVATIRETIVYDPGDTAHHGIERTVPAQFTGQDGQTYYTLIKFISVTDESGTPYNIDSQQVNRQQLYLRIGNKNQYISGPHTYVIAYSISPLVLKSNGYDRFIYNVVGTQWRTDIQQASATVKFDSQAIISAACFTGYGSATTSDCTVGTTGSTVNTATKGPLLPDQALTVDVKTQPGLVSTYLEPGKPIPLTATEKIGEALLGVEGLLLLLALGVLIANWINGRRQRKAQTIIPLYEPPDGLKPAQMSILENPSQSVSHVTATIIDLAVRGHLKIDQLQTKALFRTANYRFTKLKDFSGLAPFELELANALFRGGDTVELRDLRNQTTLSYAITKMRADLGSDLKTKGYYTVSPTNGLIIVRILGITFSVIFLIVGIGSLTSGTGSFPLLITLGLLVAVGNLAFARAKIGRTLKGFQEWAKVEGFKWFLRVTEKDRLAFTDAPDKTPELFSKMLPFAIALKVEKQWAAQFAGIDVGPAVGGWYGGYTGALIATEFTNDFAVSFSSAVSTNFAGASGGGSAGGGGGGGGGGGW